MINTVPLTSRQSWTRQMRAEPARGYAGTCRAAVIGHTGRGDYGHGLDRVFVSLPGVEIVADPDPTGRQRALALTGARRGYADYRELLDREHPEIVAVAPRQPDQRVPVCRAAAQAGVKAIYSEKPFARTLAVADQILAACAAHGSKVAVAHQNRVALPLERRSDPLTRWSSG